MKFLGPVLALLVSASCLFANDSAGDTNFSETDFESIFSPETREVSAGAGVFFSPFVATSGRPTVNYAAGLAQLGIMLTDLNDTGLWRGNFELLGEGFAGGIFEGRGTYIASASLLLRYNIAVPRWKLAPYIQAGAGLSLLDIDRRIFGQSFNFGLTGALGTRYFISEKTTINAEARFQHFSNAGMSSRNLGINSQGVVLSMSWFF